MSREWFAPQRNVGRVVVMGAESGDYMRCKCCYTGLALVVAPNCNDALPKSDASAKALCQHMVSLAASMRGHTELVQRVIDLGNRLREYMRAGQVPRIHECGPKQSYTQDGRWTFELRNKNYENAFWLAWPLLAGARNCINVGNILEAILGRREVVVRYRKSVTDMVERSASLLSEFVNSVYQYTQYTESEHDPVGEWLRDVSALSQSGPFDELD